MFKIETTVLDTLSLDRHVERRNKCLVTDLYWRSMLAWNPDGIVSFEQQPCTERSIPRGVVFFYDKPATHQVEIVGHAVAETIDRLVEIDKLTPIVAQVNILETSDGDKFAVSAIYSVISDMTIEQSNWWHSRRSVVY